MAPTRTAVAPAADCTSLGLMMSGSVTWRISFELHAPAMAMPATQEAMNAARRTRDVCAGAFLYEVMSVLEAE